MSQHPFKPRHMNASADDLAGNNGIGRYVFIPGSEGRAKEIASHFDNLVIKSHPRGHTLYLGTISCNGKNIDVAAVNSGMGCPSAEIILHELFHLGAKRFLRVGTAGSLQDFIPIGDLINAQAAVRDESTTVHYVPLEFPAIASLEFASCIMLATEKVHLSQKLHTGVIHCKSSLYAREFSAGPRSTENNSYIDLLTNSGVLATDMETSTLFIQSQFYNHKLRQAIDAPQHRVLAGAILAIVATPKYSFNDSDKVSEAIEQSIQIALETVKILATQELFN
jgi:uridine phosphorylase